MKRVKFPPGMQRNFLQNVLESINCPSLRELINRGFEIPYSTLKNYYSEQRLLPFDLFDKLCYLAKINKDKLNVEFLNSNFGQVLGGRKSKI